MAAGGGGRFVEPGHENILTEVGGISRSWKWVGAGSYNNVYVSEQIFSITDEPPKKWVLRVIRPHLDSDQASPEELERIIPLWRTINPDLPAHQYGPGWICPFIEGSRADPDQVIAGIIDIYKRTGRIILDPHKNFLAVAGKPICFDVASSRKRRDSFVSRLLSDEADSKAYSEYYYISFPDRKLTLAWHKISFAVRALDKLDLVFAVEDGLAIPEHLFSLLSDPEFSQACSHVLIRLKDDIEEYSKFKATLKEFLSDPKRVKNYSSIFKLINWAMDLISRPAAIIPVLERMIRAKSEVTPTEFFDSLDTKLQLLALNTQLKLAINIGLKKSHDPIKRAVAIYLLSNLSAKIDDLSLNFLEAIRANLERVFTHDSYSFLGRWTSIEPPEYTEMRPVLKQYQDLFKQVKKPDGHHSTPVYFTYAFWSGLVDKADGTITIPPFEL